MADPIENIRSVLSGIKQITPTRHAAPGHEDREFTIPEIVKREHSDDETRQDENSHEDSYEHDTVNEAEQDDIIVINNKKESSADNDAGNWIDITV